MDGSNEGPSDGVTVGTVGVMDGSDDGVYVGTVVGEVEVGSMVGAVGEFVGATPSLLVQNTEHSLT